MSMRPLIDPYLVIPNKQASPASSSDMSVSITSAPTILKGISMASYQAVWAGTTPVGTLAIEASNDYSLNPDGSVKNAGTWTVRPLSDDTGAIVLSEPVSGNTGSGIIDVTATGVYATRVVYTAISGSGTLLVTFNAKVA